ncbi:F0F1 ATP synthase subunit epsilon [Quadrisphaera sp. DSM 44207]|uniref:F0F1 ATP synthase subunit epsilon n=1 Tax=Quadrisphaera sp. DSM 44207 TaxID=1881057 RepID=UPI00088EED4D|nr:F0F1 ATP synthase subunit epsilon [Quadrisphaera sp. DSM 44207]SDQ73625.1 F-type H+-transporting ATPase subunit epsilon [Quadrisphaera sp. DSM 44207]
MSLAVQVVSAERQVWEGRASLVVARTTDGELGVLTGHQPTLAVLVPGEVRIEPESGSAVVATVDGGFLSIEHDTVLVVAERVTVDGGSSRSAASR